MGYFEAQSGYRRCSYLILGERVSHMGKWITNLGLRWKFLMIFLIFAGVLVSTGWLSVRAINSLASGIGVMTDMHTRQLENVLRAQRAAAGVGYHLSRLANPASLITFTDCDAQIEMAKESYLTSSPD